jgi:hypothetical protein
MASQEDRLYKPCSEILIIFGVYPISNLPHPIRNTYVTHLTTSMVHSPSWEANRSSASKEIPRTLWNPEVHLSLCSVTPIQSMIGPFLRSAFRRFSQNCEKRLLVSSQVCPSVRMEQFISHWTDFHEISYLRILRKSVEKIQVSLKSDKNNGYFIGRPIYTFDNISLSSSYKWEIFKQKLLRKSKHASYVK